MVDEIACGDLQPRIPCAGQAFVHRVGNNPRLPFRIAGDHLFEKCAAAVRGGIIDKDEFDICKRLCQKRFCTSLNERCDLEKGDDDGNFHWNR